MTKIFSYLFFVFFTCMVISCAEESTLKIETSGFRFTVNKKGFVTSIYDVTNHKEYLPANTQAPLLSMRIDNTNYILPQSAYWSEENKVLTLDFGNGRQAEVAVKQTETYFTMEIQEATVAPGEHLDLLLWGSYPTTISQTVGECVGVVRDDLFAFGIRALNPKTIGGYPSTEDDIDPAYDIFATTSLEDVADSIQVLYRGQAARHTGTGSEVHAYTRNRDSDRVIPMWGHERYVAPAYHDGGVIGSAIAVFGCPAPEVLSYLEKIVVGEGMPYPLLDGQWNKTNPDASQAYIIYPFNEKNIGEAIDFTKRTGLKYLYHGGPFSTWGNFELSPEAFPSGMEGLRKCVETASRQGIKLGIHTLSNFITTNDRYVTPVPDKRLAKVGSSYLVSNITDTQTTIEIASPDFFNQMENNSLHGVMVGNELIRYERVSETAPWTLLGCQRGAWGTKASSHQANQEISKLMDHPYNVFLSDINLTKEIAQNIAGIFNETGIEQISFDGLEGAWSTGLGQYGLSLMMKEWWDHLKPELRNNINDASMTTHYNWYIFTRMNWGEPWYAGFRESQMNYRLMNQDFYRRNLIPCMLGWFKYDATTSIEDLEWLLARSAAFDAGYTLVASPEAVKGNGNSDNLIKAIREWENARLSLAFPAELKREMEHTANEYTLTETSPASWDLYPYCLARFVHKNFERQPGEPSSTKWEFENKYERQPVTFLIKATDDISDITLTIGGYATVNLPVQVKKGYTLKYTGTDKVTIYDEYWNAKQVLTVDQNNFMVGNGKNSIVFSCKFNSRENDKAVHAELKTQGEVIKLTAQRMRQ